MTRNEDIISIKINHFVSFKNKTLFEYLIKTKNNLICTKNQTVFVHDGLKKKIRFKKQLARK